MDKYEQDMEEKKRLRIEIDKALEEAGPEGRKRFIDWINGLIEEPEDDPNSE